MRLQLLILGILFSFTISAQFERLEIDIQNVDSIPCPNDSSNTIYKFKNWSFYQTIDDTWSGEKYIDNCPSLVLHVASSINSYYVLDLSTIDSDKSLFLAYEGPEVSLNMNSIFNLYGTIRTIDNVSFKYGDDCPNGMCTGLIIKSRHSDAMYQDTLKCESYFAFNRDSKLNLLSCYTTEKTEENKIINAIYKMTLNEQSEDKVSAGSVGIDEILSAAIVHESSVIVGEQFYDGSAYNVSLSNIFSEFVDTYLITHAVQGLPSENNQSFTELLPEISKSEPTAININLEWESLYFQKYSHLIGALVEGNEPERHPVNIGIQTDICLPLVELIGTDGTNFILDGGSIEFSDIQACIQVRNHSSITIEEGQHVYMGRDGVGNVNLRSGGSIVIKEDAELIFGGKLILTPYRPYEGEEKIHIDLQGGSHLEFTKDAKILNNVFGDEMFLYIKMNGGTIDLTKLSDEDRDKVILIYPESMTSNSDIQVFPNPAQKVLTIYNPKLETIENIKIYNLQGQVVFSKKQASSDPTLELNLGELAAGLCTIIADYNKEQRWAKLIIE